jgi:peptidylprolyl isomerase
MLRRTHRLLLPIAALALLTGLTACGDKADDPSAVSADSSPVPSDGATTGATADPSTTAADEKALDAITVSGAFGSEPSVTFADKVSVSDLAVKTVSESNGAALAGGDSVFAQIWIGNGETKDKTYSTYAEKSQLLTLSSALLPALNDGLVGQKVGSRVLIAAAPAKAYGDQGNPTLGIGNADTVIFVVDLLSTVPDGPQGADKKPATWAPAIVADGDVPTALDFDAVPKPSGKLQRTTLIQGTGALTKKGDHIYVNYLGEIYGGDKPFDESYSRGTPFDFDLGAGRVVKGWDQGLVGVKVGSRVILQIPPSLGYGESGQPDVGIGATDTMYFIVDVLAAN